MILILCEFEMSAIFKEKKKPKQTSSNDSPSRGAVTILVPRKLILVFFFVLFTKFLAFAAPFFLIPVSLIFHPENEK